jgi:hypothetical protein
VRTCTKPDFADRAARVTGRRRRRPATFRPGHPRRQLPIRKARHGQRHLRHRRGGRAHGRPCFRRLDHRQVRMALDIPDQRTRRGRAGISHRGADKRSPAVEQRGKKFVGGPDRLRSYRLEPRLSAGGHGPRSGRRLVRVAFHHGARARVGRSIRAAHLVGIATGSAHGQLAIVGQPRFSSHVRPRADARIHAPRQHLIFLAMPPLLLLVRPFKAGRSVGMAH